MTGLADRTRSANEHHIFYRVAVNSGMSPSYDGFLIKRFENPDEVLTFEKGHFEIVRIGSITSAPAMTAGSWATSRTRRSISSGPITTPASRLVKRRLSLAHKLVWKPRRASCYTLLPHLEKFSPPQR
jgi:hypothetical protein